MKNCKEYDLDDIMAITAIPVADIPAGEPSSPANSLTPVISGDSFAPTLAHAITIGRELLDMTAGGGTPNRSAFLVPAIRRTGKAKDDTSDGVAGRSHSVTVSCEVDERGGEIWGTAQALGGTPCSLRLERIPHHLVLVFRDKTAGFVSATRDSYRCNVERDGAKVSVSFHIHNIMGIQMLAYTGSPGV